MKKKKIFYGWYVVFACMILAAASTGMLSYLNPLFVEPVTEDLGISRATFMVYQTFSTIATVICMPLASSLHKKIPLKVMILTGALFGAAAEFCYSSATSVHYFYLGGTFAGIGTCLYGSIPMAVLTANWFHEKKGIATGLIFAGTGAASSLLSPVVSNIIANYGWQSAYRLICILILCTVVPVTLFIIRETPEQMGLLPYGEKGAPDPNKEIQGFSRKEIFSGKAFWVFALGIFLLGCVTGPAQQQLVAYWTSEGNSASFASYMYSVVMFTAIFTKIFLGIVYDHTSVSKGTIMVGSLAVLSYLCLLLFPRGYAIFIPAVLFAVTASVQVLVDTYVVSRLFGDREYAFVYGIVTPILYVGSAVDSPLSAAVYDIFGNYRLLWVICAGLFALAVVTIVCADHLSKKEYRQRFGTERY